MNGFNEEDQGKERAKERRDRIEGALRAVLDARSSNVLRQEASAFLEHARTAADAPELGYSLAIDPAQTPSVRHYGLSLLEYSVRRRWADYSSDQSAALRQWVLELGQNVRDEDPGYIVGKLGEIWVEMAKRSWAVDWLDMDQQLVQLWDTGTSGRRVLVLYVLEALSDECFTTEDAVVALRSSELSRACVEIFLPAAVLAEAFPKREIKSGTRYGDQGWLTRLSVTLQMLKTTGSSADVEALVRRVLSTLRSTFGWVLPRALVATSAIDHICLCLTDSDARVQLVSADGR